MFKSHFIKLNHKVLNKTEQIPMEHLFLHLTIVLLFLAAEMCTKILSKLDIYGAATIGPLFYFQVLLFILYCFSPVMAPLNVEERVRSQAKKIDNLDVKYLLFEEKIMFKSHFIKLNHRVLSKTEQIPVEHQFWHPITVPLFQQLKYLLTFCLNQISMVLQPSGPLFYFQFLLFILYCFSPVMAPLNVEERVRSQA